MHLPDQRETSTAALVLPAILDLAQADALLGMLLAGMDDGEPTLSIDGSVVEVTSTACLQVLAAAALTSTARGGHFALSAASPALLAASRDLGLLATLGLEEA